MRGLERAFGKENAVVTEYTDRNAMDIGKAGARAPAVKRFEFVKFGIVYQPGDNPPNVVLFLQMSRRDAVELGGLKLRLTWFSQGHIARLPAVQGADDLATERQRMTIILRVVIRNAGFSGMHVGAAQLFGSDDLAGRCFDQRRAARKNPAL